MCLMFYQKKSESRWIDVITGVYRSSVYAVELE
jgi:hypothetical protein